MLPRPHQNRNSDLLTNGPAYDLHQLYLDLAGEIANSPTSDRRPSIPNLYPPSHGEPSFDSKSSKRRGSHQSSLPYPKYRPRSPSPLPPTFPPNRRSEDLHSPSTSHKPHAGSSFMDSSPSSNFQPFTMEPAGFGLGLENGDPDANLHLPWHQRHRGWLLTGIAFFCSVAFMVTILTLGFTTTAENGGVARRSLQAAHIMVTLDSSTRVTSPGIPRSLDDGRSRGPFG